MVIPTMKKGLAKKIVLRDEGRLLPSPLSTKGDGTGLNNQL